VIEDFFPGVGKSQRQDMAIAEVADWSFARIALKGLSKAATPSGDGQCLDSGA
jgi:hypothetical protein